MRIIYLKEGAKLSLRTFCSCSNKRKKENFFYLDPPYQGTSQGRDQRYVAGVSRERMIEALDMLNEKRVPFVLSYDGSCGERTYGEALPENIAHRILLDVGRSSQATLSGREEVTIESLYVSHAIPLINRSQNLSLSDFGIEREMFR
jgi:DNA adenine methylase